MVSKAAKKPTNWAKEVWELFLLLLAVLGVHSLIAKPFYIPSASMLPGLYIGDRLIVSKFPYGYSYLSPSFEVLPEMKGRLFGSLPERGDVVVLKSPTAHDDWIKRVIGLPGDTVEMRGGQLWLNGKAVPKVPEAPYVFAVAPVNDPPGSQGRMDCVGEMLQQYAIKLPDGRAGCAFPRFRETLPSGKSYDVLDTADVGQDNYGPVIVPEGHLFLMGDNRDNSEDSRFDQLIGGLGMLPIENLVGRAEFTTFSLDGNATLNPLSWFQSLRPGRYFLSLRHAQPVEAAKVPPA